MVTSHTSRAAKAAVKILSTKCDKSIECFQALTFQNIFEENTSLCGNAPPAFQLVDELDRNAIILHSSGSTDLPKPIYQTHKYLLSYAACHKFSPDDYVSGVCTSTLPLFHVGAFSLLYVISEVRVFTYTSLSRASVC